MEGRLIFVLAAAAAILGTAENESAPRAEPALYEAEFAPLRRSERSAAEAGPVGPYYPAAAVHAGKKGVAKNGEATLQCRAGEGGVLEACRIVSEMPRGLDFGPAAKVMARRQRIRAAGSPTPGDTIHVRVPFVWGAPVSVEP
jgi:hypothetical protein